MVVHQDFFKDIKMITLVHCESDIDHTKADYGIILALKNRHLHTWSNEQSQLLAPGPSRASHGVLKRPRGKTDVLSI